MKIKQATFITSAAKPAQFIHPDKPMIAVSGKSNVGKSSFINMLANQRRLARTSAEPGRTRLVNYFDFGDFILADLPGYGYARVSKEEKLHWADTLNAFFAKREDIAHVFALVDLRHDPTEDDRLMMNFLYCSNIDFSIVATKSDKLSRMKVKENVRRIAGTFALPESGVIATSSVDGTGKDAVLAAVDRILQAEKLKRKVAATLPTEEEDE